MLLQLNYMMHNTYCSSVEICTLCSFDYDRGTTGWLCFFLQSTAMPNVMNLEFCQIDQRWTAKSVCTLVMLFQ